MAELQTKTEFQGCQCFLKFLQIGLYAAHIDFMASNFLDIMSPTSRESCDYPTTLG